MYNENLKIPFKSSSENKRGCYIQNHFSYHIDDVMPTESNNNTIASNRRVFTAGPATRFAYQ